MLYLKDVVYHPPAALNPILQGINLELAPQELGLIVGPSGSGKTTLLEILAGFADKTGRDDSLARPRINGAAPATIRRNRFSVS